ncbi:MAG: hypothetical protein AABX65_02930 [Nanoarchaeota archaeon]
MKAIKKGQVGVITTVVLLVVALVAVSIFWLTTRGLLTKQTEQLTADCATINLQIVDAKNNTNSITVKRDVGVGELAKVLVYVAGSVRNNTFGSIGVLETKSIFINNTGANLSVGQQVQISGVIKGPSGNEIQCPFADTQTVQ